MKTFRIEIEILIIWPVEHLLCIGATVHSILIYHSDKDILTELIRSLVPHLVPQGEPLPTFVALLICCINESATFVWNFLDIFLMIVGVGLSTHFKVFNNELEHAAVEMEVKFQPKRREQRVFFRKLSIFLTFQSFPIDFIMEMRIQYTKLCDLVATVDKRISHLVLLSFSNNFILICKQLFESLRCV